MIKKIHKKIFLFTILALFIIALITLLYFISPEQIVNKIGVQNGYLLAFFISFFGGFSAAGSITFISILITLVAGGLNPLYLGLIAGISLAIGDMIMFFAGSKGRELFSGKWNNKIDRLANFIMKKKWLKKSVPVLAYLYIGLSPLPNDIVILFLAAIKYPYKKMSGVIILGDITFALLVTLLATKGIVIFG
jgi:hypothetical protein